MRQLNRMITVIEGLDQVLDQCHPFIRTALHRQVFILRQFTSANVSMVPADMTLCHAPE
jgi:hypothetical protein